MPSLLEFAKRNNGAIAKHLAFSFAAYISFYHNGTKKGEGCLIGKRGDDSYEIKDDQAVLDFYYAHRDDPVEELADAVISNKDFWGDSLMGLSGFKDEVIKDLKLINEKGMYEAIRSLD